MSYLFIIYIFITPTSSFEVSRQKQVHIPSEKRPSFYREKYKRFSQRLMSI